MADSILDIDGHPIEHLSAQLPEQTDSSIMIIQVPCMAGAFLQVEDNAHVRVLGRLNNTANIFQDLHTQPIDLTPFDGLIVSFDIMLRANAVDGDTSEALELKAAYL